jgi:hypothetical protein
MYHQLQLGSSVSMQEDAAGLALDSTFYIASLKVFGIFPVFACSDIPVGQWNDLSN